MLRSQFYLVVIGAIITLSTSVLADTRNWNPQGDGCVDPKGFLSCYQKNIDAAVGCTKVCNSTVTPPSLYSNCIQGCDGFWLASNIGCWIQSCWNEVYSCEYQLTAIDYFDGQGLVQNGVVPFYPPPDDASTGACSCNLGYVYGNDTYINNNNACLDVAGSGDFDLLYSCECCEFGFPVSNVLNVCPKSDLTILGFQNRLAHIQQLISKSKDNCAILDNSPDLCVTQYGYPWYGNATNPLNLPEGEPGTEPLSNLPGNAFTKFDVPAYTLQLFPGYSSILTPAPFKNNAGVNTQTVAAGSAGITATAPSGTGTSAASGANSAATGKGTATSAKTGSNTSGGAGAAQTSAKTGAAKAVFSGKELWAGCVVWAAAILFL